LSGGAGARAARDEEEKVDEVEDVEVKVTEHTCVSLRGWSSVRPAVDRFMADGKVVLRRPAVVVDDDVKVEEHVMKYTKALKQG
jgi:hypothetical protein